MGRRFLHQQWARVMMRGLTAIGIMMVATLAVMTARMDGPFAWIDGFTGGTAEERAVIAEQREVFRQGAEALASLGELDQSHMAEWSVPVGNTCTDGLVPVQNRGKPGDVDISNFDRKNLSPDCQADYNLCLIDADRNGNGRIDLSNNEESARAASCIRAAMACERDVCQARIQEQKRSALITGIVIFCVGILLGFVSPQLAFYGGVLAAFFVLLSIAPIFDIWGFMTCR